MHESERVRCRTDDRYQAEQLTDDSRAKMVGTSVSSRRRNSAVLKGSPWDGRAKRMQKDGLM